MDAALVQQIETDYRQASLEPSIRALLDYALRLTCAPASVRESDIDGLRAVGFSDEQILAANLVASYFNFINRVADGLGIDPEEEMKGRAPLPAFVWSDDR